MVTEALKSFNSDPEVYYLVVDSISELITVGKDELTSNKRFVQDIWSLIHIFAKKLKPIRNSSTYQVKKKKKTNLKLI
jgi:predicted site-specific integrase-resolvase